MPQQFWLMKSEPDVFSFNDLKKAKNKTTEWDGVRNAVARNNMKKMKVGDGVFFYHSRVKPMAIIGTAKVVKEAYPDQTQFDKKSKYFDPKATKETPRWFMVDVEYDKAFKEPVTLEAIKQTKSLTQMVLVRMSRLSVQPVTKKEWGIIKKLGGL